FAEVNANRPESVLTGEEHRCSGAVEWVQHYSFRGRGGKDRNPDEIFGKRSPVCAISYRRGDFPRVKRRKNPARRQPPADSMPVVVIPPALGEVEHVLVRNRAPVGDVVRYRVRLYPYHAMAHEPALFLQRDGEPVRDEQELFRPCPLAVTGPVLGPQPEPARPLLQLPALVRALAT